MNALVPAWFRSLVFSAYPALQFDVRWQRLMCRLLFSSRICKWSGEVLVDSDTLAGDAGVGDLAVSNNFYAEGFLESFKANVLGDLTWSGWNPERGACRTAQAKFCQPVADALADLDLHSGWLDGNHLVYFVGGFVANRSRASKFLDDKRDEALTRVANAECPEACDLLAYLNDLPTNAFQPLSQNAKALLKDWQSHACLRDLDDLSRVSQLRVLRAIAESPVPVYQPSPRGCTARIFGMGESILNLKSDLRRELCPGWFEADLRNAQLAIVGRQWDVDAVQEFLSMGKSLWDDLLPFLGVPLGDPRRAAAKAACKTALYAMIFGMPLPSVKGG